MATPNLKITEADFAKIKENLKNFLKAQTTLSDYDFDGAALNILLDILASNTAYGAFYLNMQGSESYLDSASLRNNVVSIAKHLGYTPRSARSARARITITVDPAFGPGDPAPSSILVPTSQEFSTSINSKLYYFSPSAPILIVPVNGSYTATDVEIVEGKRLSYQWTVDTKASIKQRYVIPNANMDTTQLVVKVQDSATSNATRIFKLNEDITTITASSQVYFLQEVDGGKYEIYFGDGTVGAAVADGNIVIAEYIVSSGNIVIGAKTFTPVSKLSGYTSTTVACTTPAKDSEEPESIDSIKLLAPLNFEAQNRAVTKNDYETLIKKEVPGIQYVRVWGGEDNDPPDFGKVYIALKPDTGLALSEEQKDVIIKEHIQPRNMISIEAKIVEPEYLFVKVDCSVLYNSRFTTLGDADIKTLVANSIATFAANELNGFDADLRYSHLVKAVDATEGSIRGNLTTITLKFRIVPPLDVPTKYTININNAISRGDALNNVSAINSSAFIFRGILTYIGDNGLGTLYLYRLVNNTRVIIQDTIGTVNYTTGKIILDSLEVQSIPNEQNFIDLFIIPQKNDVTALREQILLIDPDDISVFVEDQARRV